ncbi:MAG: PAS domain S-box protein [Cyanobacteriota bacterium]|nr:PAS domain S-box protein [Cyanobacteriota bacterium]
MQPDRSIEIVRGQHLPAIALWLYQTRKSRNPPELGDQPKLMRDEEKTKAQLIEELVSLRERVAELEKLVSDRYTIDRVLYRNILDHAIAGFFQITPDRQYMVANMAMAEILGYSSPLEMTTEIDDIATQVYVDSDRYYEFQRLLEENDAVKEFEYQAYRKDGTLIWVSDNVHAVRDLDGTILYYEGNSIDISERKASEVELSRTIEERTAALRESNKFLVREVVGHYMSQSALQAVRDQLKAILEAVPGMVSCVSADLRYLGVNRSLARVFNVPPEAFIGQDLGFLGTGLEFSDFVRDFFDSSRQEAYCEISAQVNGQTRNYVVVAQKYANSCAAFTVGIDITERRRVESELKAAKNQLQAILDAVPGIVSWISSDLRYLGVNQHLAKTFGIRAEAFVGQDIGFLGTGSQFNQFVREFFVSNESEAYREVAAQVKGKTRNYLIVAQKYDENRAAFVVGIDISDRKATEKALRETEAKYRSIFEHIIEGIFQISPEGQYLSANPALARIYGYRSPEDLKLSLSSPEAQIYVYPQQREQFMQRLEERDRVVGFEAQIYRQDGTIAWISENARAVRDEQGNLLYYEGTVEDISERKRAEETLHHAYEQLELRVEERTSALKDANAKLLKEISERERVEQALRNSEAELRALFAAMTDIITVFDSEGRYVKVVSTNSEVLYSPTANRIGKTVYDVLLPEEADFFVAEIQRVLNSGQTLNLEYCLCVAEEKSKRSTRRTSKTLAQVATHADELASRGTLEMTPPKIEKLKFKEVWFAATVSPLPNNCAIWVARNITERKRMLDALSQAEAKYRSIFENAAEGIFQTSPDGKFLSANPALVKMCGYTSARELKNSILDIGRQLYVDSERRDELVALLEEQDAVYHSESQLYRKDGSIIWVSENVRAVRDERGKLLYYEGTVDDITQRKRTEEKLRVEQEKSERLLLNILPKAIVEQLKQYQGSLAERFDEATVLFADIVGFTPLSSRIPPLELVNLLNRIFSNFDRLAERHGLEKIKTIGDAYMVAGGLPLPQPDRIAAIADMALEMQASIDRFRDDLGEPFQIRIGINTGPVVAGVIGIKKFIYDLWGDTVNVASRMESQGAAGKIQVTETTYERLKDRYRFEKRGTISVKGRGEMVTYWLEGRNSKS